MADSLKRKRGTLADDTTPDPERDGTHKKKDTAKSDDIDLPHTAVANTADESISTFDTHMDTRSVITNPDTTSINSPPGTNTVPDDTNPILAKALSRSQWRKLPGELRNRIYEYLAGDEDRIVLSRRFVEARRNNSPQTLHESFEASIALHPLSMTCKLFREEFQQVHVEASEPYWKLVVNNFDLEQLKIFRDFIQDGDFIKVVEVYGMEEEQWPFNVPVYNRNVSLRFQMDNGALSSALALCRHVYFDRDEAGGEADAPLSLASWDISDISAGIAEFSAQYVPRMTVPGVGREGMIHQDAKRIESVFKYLRSKVMKNPDYESPGASGVYGNDIGCVSLSFDYMVWCWFDEFYYSVKTMRAAHESQPEGVRRINKKLERARAGLAPIESLIEEGL